MSKKERLEDLGRLYEKINLALDHEIFDLYSGRKKDFEVWFYSLDSEKQHSILHTLIYGIDHISEKLHEMFYIAQGEE